MLADQDLSNPFDKLNLQEISEEECLVSVKRLRDFLGIPLDTFQTLRDFSAHASLIEENIRRIIIRQIEIRTYNHRFPISIPLKEEREITAYLGKRHTFIRVYQKIENRSATANNVPQPTDLGITDNSMEALYEVLLHVGSEIIDETNVLTPNMHATDYRQEITQHPNPITYYPTQYTYYPHHQQGFARLLKECIQSLLSVVPQEQTEIPEQFKKLQT